MADVAGNDPWLLEIDAFLNADASRQSEKRKASTNLSNLFGGLTIARVGVSGQANDLSKIVQKYGGSYSGFISKKCTHVITSAEDVKFNKYKLDTARKYNCSIVSIAWFYDSISAGIVLDEDIYKIEIEEIDKNTIFAAYSNDPITFLTNDENTTTNTSDVARNGAPSASESTQAHRPRYFGLTRIYPWGDKCAPYFPAQFEVVKKVVFHCTDLDTNQNKYYAMEIHNATEGSRSFWRVFTHYGRTDELDDASSGKRECRYVSSKEQAEMVFNMIYEEKSSDRKNYQEVNLVSANIGSNKSMASAGSFTDAAPTKSNPRKRGFAEAMGDEKIHISPKIKALVNQVYDEATNMLTSIVQAKITPRGIETPLGILTVEQIEKGNEILTELESVLEGHNWSADQAQSVRKLSNSFYSVIPHRIGKSAEELSRAIIDSLDVLQEKQELLQLMKDIAKIAEESSGTSLTELEVELKYKALNCEISELPTDSVDYLSLIKTISGEDPADEDKSDKKIQVLNVYKIKRGSEDANFTNMIFNRKLLFHGSRIENWLGILSRGLLLPKRVTNLGVNRTDYGLLGAGLYFAPQAATSVNYSTLSKKRGNRFMVCCEVALGNVKQFTQQAPDLSAAPINYHSCHGVPATKYFKTAYQEDQYVVYNSLVSYVLTFHRRNQQRVKYLIEFKLIDDEVPEAEDLVENDFEMDESEEEETPVEPPKKKQKLDADDDLDLSFLLTPMARPIAAPSISNAYAKMLATANANKKILQNNEISQTKKDDGDNFEIEEDDDDVVIDFNENGGEIELPEGVKLLPIKEINPYVSRAAVKGRVIYKSEIFKWTVDKKHTQDGCFFYFEIIDENRDGLRCVAYNTEAKKFYEIIKEDKVYVIIQPIVKFAYAKGIALVKNDYELNLGGGSDVKESPLDFYSFPKREIKLQDLAAIRDLPHGSVVDFVAVAVEVGPLGFLASPNTGNDMPKRTVYINDDTNTKSQLVLWYSFAEKSPVEKGQVFLVTGAYVNEYKGFKTINTKHASVRFDVNTKLPEAKKLRKWYQQHKFEIEAENNEQKNSYKDKNGNAKSGKTSKPFTKKGNVTEEEPMEVDEITAGLAPLGQLLMPTWTEREQFAQEFSRLLLREKKVEKWPEIMRGALVGVPDAMFQLVLARLPFKSLMRLKKMKKDTQKIVGLITNYIVDSAIEYENSVYKRLSEAGKSKFSRGLLINVFEEFVLFAVRNLDDEEKYFPIIVPPSSKYLQQFSSFEEGSPSIVSSQFQFASRFDKFTNNFFVDFEWDRTVVSGGAVLAALEPVTPSQDLNSMNSEWASSDIDIYFVGMTASEAEAKIKRIHDKLARHVGVFNIVVVRTKNALTFCSQYPQRNIQIILALFSRPEDIVAHYDLDCVSVLYDGSNVFALPRAVRALNTRINFVDLNHFTRQTRSHEKRQMKYSQRGFGSLIVNHSNMIPALFTPKKQDRDLSIAKFQSQMHTPKSLAKALMMQYTFDQSEKSSSDQMGFEMALDNGGGFLDLPNNATDHNNNNANDSDKTDPINYGEGAYLPYGPEWSPARLQQHLRENQNKGNSGSQFYIFGSLDYCLDTGDDDPNAAVSRFIKWE